MKTDYISKIIHRYFSGDYPPEMQEKLQAWLLNEDKMLRKEETLLCLWDELKVTNDECVYTSLQEIKRKLAFQDTGNTEKNRKHAHSDKRTRLRAAFLSMAAISLLCVLGGWWYYFSTHTEWINVTTAYGENTLCLLPDSSSVWIKPGSTLSYPKSFKGNFRQVRLSGEARFAVTKNAGKPFIIQTNTFAIQVLGTTFHVSDYPDNQQTAARLEEGKIQITLPHNKKYILSPNQKIIVDKITRTAAITSTCFSNWKEGELIFEDMPLHDILQGLKRHYGIPFLYRDFHPDKERYSIKFASDETVEQALDLLQTLTENFIWNKHNNQIIIHSWHK